MLIIINVIAIEIIIVVIIMMMVIIIKVDFIIRFVMIINEEYEADLQNYESIIIIIMGENVIIKLGINLNHKIVSEEDYGNFMH